MSEPKQPYVPTPEEVQGNSWAYCYGEAFVIENDIADPATIAADLYYKSKDSEHEYHQ